MRPSSSRLQPTVAALAVAVLLAGCQTGQRQALSGPLGGEPSSGRTVVGGLVSGDIGSDLDAEDKEAAFNAEFQALDRGRAGVTVTWRNQRSGHYGEVTPGPGYDVNEYSCRDYTHVVYVGGESRSARGTACREPDGNWRPVS